MLEVIPYRNRVGSEVQDLMVLAGFAALRIGFFGRYGRCLQEIQLARSNSVGFTSMKDLLYKLV